MSRRRLVRQNSSSKYDVYNDINSRSVVDVRSLAEPQGPQPPSASDVENSIGVSAASASEDDDDEPPRVVKRELSFRGLLPSWSRHSNISFNPDDLIDDDEMSSCSSGSSNSSSSSRSNERAETSMKRISIKISRSKSRSRDSSEDDEEDDEERQQQHSRSGSCSGGSGGSSSNRRRRPSLKRTNSLLSTGSAGSFRGLVKQLSWKASHFNSSCYKEYDHDDTFLNVCRLDEERSKLIGLVEEPNMMKLLKHWTGTIFAEIIYDFVFWATLLLYILLRIWIQMGFAHDTLDTISSKAKVLDSLPIVGGFLTLFLVFFVNQNHTRYYNLHDCTMKIMGSICDLAALLASSPFLPIERARRINRYCNAAHVVMYAGLTRYLQDGEIVQHLTRDYALLTEDEKVRMEDCGMYEGKASACFELLTWSLQDVNRALSKKMIDAHQASEMRMKITDFRSTVAKIVVTCLCPIPFFYVHFLSLLTAIYLPLFALMVSFKTGHGTILGDYRITWLAEIVGFFLVVLQSLFVVGLRILGQQMGNPYGEDFIDMQITTYIIMVLSTSNRTLESMDVNDIYNNGNRGGEYMMSPDPQTELQLKLDMVNLGDAWGIKRSKTISTRSLSSSSSSSSSSHRYQYNNRRNTNNTKNNARTPKTNNRSQIFVRTKSNANNKEDSCSNNNNNNNNTTVLLSDRNCRKFALHDNNNDCDDVDKEQQQQQLYRCRSSGSSKKSSSSSLPLYVVGNNIDQQHPHIE